MKKSNIQQISAFTLSLTIIILSSCSSLKGISDQEKLFSKQWKLVELNQQAVKDTSFTPTLGFDPEKTLAYGYGGCNRFSTGYKFTSAHSIQFNQIISTKMACMNDNPEREFFHALAKVEVFEMSKSTLIMFNGSGERIIVFKEGHEETKNQSK